MGLWVGPQAGAPAGTGAAKPADVMNDAYPTLPDGCVYTPVSGLWPDSSLDMKQVQVVSIGSGGGGTGTLHYHDRTDRVAVAGRGIGDIGASTSSATR